MGQEIVYCFKCATRLMGSDFEHGRAVRAGNRAACKDCAVELLASVPKEERPDPTPPKNTRVASSTKMKTVPSSSSTVRIAMGKGPEQKGKTGLVLLLGAIGLGAIGMAVFMGGGLKTPPEETVGPRRAEPKRNESRPETENPSANPPANPPKEKPRPGENFDTEVAKLREKAKAEAEAAKKETPAPVVPNPPVPPAPASEEAKGYRLTWQAAVVRAAGREYDAAEADLAKAARDAKEEAVKGEATADAADFKGMGALYREALKKLSESAKGTTLQLDIREDGALKSIKGRVERAGPERVELVNDAGAVVIVDWSEVATRTLAQVSGSSDRRSQALLCLVEGDVDGGRAYGDGVPEKYLAFAAEAAAKIPQPPARDVEARKLFAQAAGEFSKMESLGSAVAKYKALLTNYADSRVVRSETALIRKRSEAGAEYLICATALKAEGTFRLATPAKAEVAWVSSADSERGSFVDAEFYALPETMYRCWVYVGGCCAETFTFHYQTTDATDVNPRTKQREPIEPGANIASPAKHSITGLKKTHALHAKNKEPKSPDRWEWVNIPLPKYPSPGVKKLRILNDQQGFGVAAVFVTSTRSTPPPEPELKEELIKARPPSAAVPEGLVGHWRLDDNTFDYSPSGRPGKAQGSISFVPGKVGGAVKFPNAGEIEVAPFAFSAKALTLAVWVNHESLDNHVQRYVTIGSEVAVIRHENRSKGLQFYIKTDNQLRILSVQDMLDTGKWHLIVGTWDGATQTLYRDAAKVGAIQTGGSLGVGESLRISMAGEPMHGLLDDVRVYNRALSEDEVRVLYAQGPGTSATAPAPAAGGKPWRPIFDGKSLDCFSPGIGGWKAENGAIVRLPVSKSDALQSRETMSDGQVRIRFECKDLEILWLKIRQGAEGGFSVDFPGAVVKSLEGGIREVIFTAQADRVTATLDGKDVAVRSDGPAKQGHIQFNAAGKSLTILSIEVR